ncbi:adenylate/guanylate cyclase domain-containing protein [Desulfatiferula olefinivorans]
MVLTTRPGHRLKKLLLMKVTRDSVLVRFGLSLFIVFFFLLHLPGFIYIPFIEPVENFLYDIRLIMTMPKTADSRIVIVDIDEKSLAAEGRWPWGRDRLAKLVDILFEDYQINLVAFDMVFAERDESSGIKFLDTLAEQAFKDEKTFIAALNEVRPSLERDAVFARSLSANPVILGYYFQPLWQTQNTMAVGRLPEAVLDVDASQLKNLPFVKTGGYIGNLAQLTERARGAGYFDNPLVDADGMFRRTPMVQEYQGKLYESLSLAVVRLLLGSPELEFEVAGSGDDPATLGLEGLKIGSLRIPVDGRGAALIPYRGRQGSFPYVSAVDVLTRKVDPEQLRGVIVLVGSTTPGLKDLRSTPVQNVYPGIEIHANLISGMLDQTIKHKPGYALGIEFVFLIVVGLIVSILLSRLSPLGALVSTLAVTGVSVWYNVFLWENHNLVVGMSSILLLVLTLFVFHMSYGFFMEANKKKQISKLFAQYVPPELVREMSESPSDFGMSGESLDMTVIFADIRNFTPISETMHPRQLTQLVNEIFTFLTRIIYRHRGTIDKYIGDEIMAFWGAPLPDDLHARHALETALAMIEELPVLQKRLKRQGRPPIDIGIGINTGIMSVGNMGSEYRMAYTVLGDAVNLGSRIAGLTKIYHIPVILSEFTAKSVEGVPVQEIDRVRVKGKAEPVTLFSPRAVLSGAGIMAPDDGGLFESALTHYRNQRWQAAEQQFAELIKRSENSTFYTVFLERIRMFRDRPPGEHWDGVVSL